VYQLELSTGSAGKWGTVSEVQSAETAVLIAGMAERDVGTAAVPTGSSKVEGCTLMWGEASARYAPELSRADGLPLLLS
jgi:hypothetical protein